MAPKREKNYKQGQVLDLTKAIENISSQADKEKKEAFKITMRNLKPVLKQAPALKLFGEPDEFFITSDEYQPISLELVTFQIILSKVLHHVLTLKAANLTLKDIVNNNRKKRPLEI